VDETVYMVVTLDVQNPEMMTQYAEAALPLLPEYGGDVLCGSDEFDVIEGNWPRERVVILRFPNKEKANSFFFSDAYQKAREFRTPASTLDAIIIRSALKPYT